MPDSPINLLNQAPQENCGCKIGFWDDEMEKVVDYLTCDGVATPPVTRVYVIKL